MSGVFFTSGGWVMSGIGGRIAGRVVVAGLTLAVTACASRAGMDVDARVPPGSGPERLAGMYRYLADAGIFTDCRTGSRYPVARVADNPALERAYLASHRDPGEPLKVIVAGRIEPRPAMEGGGDEESLVVDRFIEQRPGENCDMAIMQARLARGKWVLAQLQGQVLASETVPYLRFDPAEPRVSGFTGCNTLTGGYVLGEDRLTFSAPATTRKYCVETANLERTFLGALEQTRQVRVTEDRLELLDDAGRALARFRAAE